MTLQTSFDYRRGRSLSSRLVALWLALGAALALAQTPPPFEVQVEARTIALTNQFRAQHGLEALTVDARLADTAREYAGYIARADKLDHDADGSSPAERIRKGGYVFCMVAENLASEFDTRGFSVEALSHNLVKGWSESPTHRANMLQPDVTQMGMGVARNPKSGEYYAVQVFARPISQVLRFRVTNRTGATVRYDYRGRNIALSPKQARSHDSCAPGEIRLDAAGQLVTLRPKDGGRYAVVETGRGNFKLSEE